MSLCEHEEGTAFTCMIRELQDRLIQYSKDRWQLYDGWVLDDNLGPKRTGGDKLFYAWLKRLKTEVKK